MSLFYNLNRFYIDQLLNKTEMPNFAEQAILQAIRELVEEASQEGIKTVAKKGAQKTAETATKGALKGLASETLDHMLRNPALLEDILEKSLKSGMRSSGGVLLTKSAQKFGEETFEELLRAGAKGAGGKLPSFTKVAGAGAKSRGIPHLGYMFDGAVVLFRVAYDGYLYRNGKISGQTLFVNTSKYASGAVGGAIGASIGQCLIPIPVVGGIVGGVVGTLIAENCGDAAASTAVSK